MTNTETIIADVLNRYVLRYPREPGNKDYPVPLDVLHRISELRKQYPLTNTAQAAMREPYKIPRPTQPSSRFRYSRCLSALLSAGRVTPQLSHVRSGRLRTIPRTVLARVLRLHKRMGHAPEDVMCMAVEPKKGKPLWRNTKVTAKEIRTVFQWEPCLICVLAKRRKEGTMKWKTLKKNKRRKLRLSEEDEKKLIQQEIEEMNNCAVGELISCDDVGPISPASMDGHTRFFMFRDKRSRKKHFFAIKNNDSETFIKCFEFVIDYYESMGYKVKTLRSDYFSTFLASDLEVFRNKRNIEHQASSPHRHHQNTVEREIQTLIGYVSAVLHGTELLRADAWERAATQWVNLANDLPIACLGTSPNAMVKQGDFVDAQWQYRFAFGDLVCFHIDKVHRTWKFDTRNEVGFYMGDKKGVKGAVWVYRPYRHDRLLRDDVHKIPVSDVQLLMWYGRREEMRQAGLPFQVVRDAYTNLLPSDQFEERETTNDQVDQSQKRRKGEKRDEHHEYDDSLESDKEPETEDGGKQTHTIPSFCPSRQDRFHRGDKPEARPIPDLAGTGEQIDRRRSMGNPTPTEQDEPDPRTEDWRQGRGLALVRHPWRS